jgi:excinuclease ABC subunit C
MREVITRRLNHLKDWGEPDLIVLDGSVGQISAIRELAEKAKIPVIGRDKSGDHSKNARVRIVIPEGEEDYRMVELSKDSHIAKLIARIDEESHRFAIQYHTLLKRKDALK